MRVLLLVLLIAIADQASKQVVRDRFALGESQAVIESCFHLTYLRNTGAAWGLLGGQNAGLALLSLVVLALLVIFRRSLLTPTWEHRLALGLLGGGIVGNVADRLRQGWVTDFLDFHWRGHHWPCFNIADAAICTGVALYVLSTFWLTGHPLNDKPQKSKPDEGQAT